MSTEPLPQGDQLLTASIPPSQIPIFLRNKLKPLLPHSLPLYRRCQYFLHQLSLQPPPTITDPQSSQPEVWIALSRPSPLPATNQTSNNDWLDLWLNRLQHPLNPTKSTDPTDTSTKYTSSEIWLSTHIDLHEPGQTQIWFFGSWEPQTTPDPTSSSSSPTNPPPTATQTSLARTLFHHLRANHIRYLPLAPSQQYLEMKAAGKIVSSPFKRSKILFGTLAESSWWVLGDDVVRGSDLARSQAGTSQDFERAKSNDTAITRRDMSYLKYILALPLAPAPAEAQPMSSNLTLRPLSKEHLQTVLDRTTIPRTLELLLTLPTAGVFPDSTSTFSSEASATTTPSPSSRQHTTNSRNHNTSTAPISWGILSKDASLSSLHTEPEYRGQGLAQVVSRELIRLAGERFRSHWGTETGHGEDDAEEASYAHTDVSASNVASRRVFEKMGARVGWKVAWIEVDVEFDAGAA